MNTLPHLTEVQQICIRHGISINTFEAITGSFDKKIFIINDEFLLRISERSMAGEQEKFRRVAHLDYVPQIVHVGELAREASPLYYTLLTLIPGDDFVNVWFKTTPAQQTQASRDVAAFMDSLHAMQGTHYDIGLYIPTIPDFTGTWREGHRQYQAMLQQDAGALALTPESKRVFEDAFRYLHDHADALDYQAGSVLLHNDFHPKNTLLHHGRFSGVIDWECSQYGEADFELTHLIHWCVYPPEAGIDYKPFLRGLFDAAPTCSQVPQLAQRLTLYQIEHEIQQIIWNVNSEGWRVPRLRHWMDDGVDTLLRQVR